MAAISQYLTAQMLNWTFNGAAATQPTKWGVGLSLGSPTSISGSEVGTASGYLRQTMAWGAAGTPTSSGTVSNASALTFGPFSTAQSISGICVWDTVLATVNAGNLLWFGLLGAARTVAVADSLVLPTASLILTLT